MNADHLKRAGATNRKERRSVVKEQHRFVASLPEQFVDVASDEVMRQYPGSHPPKKIWRNRYYLVMLFDERNVMHPDLIRLSICRSKVGMDGRWQDGIAWDELQQVKRDVGFGEWYAVEIYPPDRHLINVANMRHLWLLPHPLQIGWVQR